MPSTTRSQRTNARIRIFYVTYDGITEPLGRSQVLAYLTRLASSSDITLLSFEKSRPSNELRQYVADAGIRWRPLRYHRRPPVISTAIDVLAGALALLSATAADRPEVVHVRSYVPALMALLARWRTGGRLLFDIRGFWADERVEGGIWRAGGFLYSIAKRFERRFFAAADGVVTLTRASVPQIKLWLGDRTVPIEVIPTCVDARRFAGGAQRPDGPHAVWCGSIGTWYRFDLAPDLATALELPLTVITRQADLARAALGGYPASVHTAAPEQVQAELFEGDIGLCLITPSFSKVASAPTRFAEFLAAGMPVVVTAGVGDLESLVETERVGVVLRGDDPRAITTAAHQMQILTAEHGVIQRCRRLAREQFDVEVGAAKYAALYTRLSGVEAPPIQPRCRRPKSRRAQSAP